MLLFDCLWLDGCSLCWNAEAVPPAADDGEPDHSQGAAGCCILLCVHLVKGHFTAIIKSGRSQFKYKLWWDFIPVDVSHCFLMGNKWLNGKEASISSGMWCMLQLLVMWSLQIKWIHVVLLRLKESVKCFICFSADDRKHGTLLCGKTTCVKWETFD